MNATQLQQTSDGKSTLGLLLRAAEYGLLSDRLVRIGIRRLLRARIRDLKARLNAEFVDAFLESVADQPVAIATELANEQHYEVPADFYRAVLGHRLKYSCCYWPTEVDSLDQAEDEALRVTCENAALSDGMDILELGCGWGSLSLWMADRFPNSEITAISNSNSQRKFIQRRAAERGISNLKVVTADINQFNPAQVFDRVVSVEMFEHMRNHRRLMSRIHDWLRPGGQLFAHLFCHKETPYLFETTGAHNWMGRHFFSGGMMPSANLLPRAGSPLKLVDQTKWSGIHYAKTCRAWLKNQDLAANSLQGILASTYGESEVARWHNRWRLFFMACEELFAFDDGNEWFVSHYRFQR
jgi:cyclopropane-fatty-acyl-phospholipid synthase